MFRMKIKWSGRKMLGAAAGVIFAACGASHAMSLEEVMHQPELKRRDIIEGTVAAMFRSGRFGDIEAMAARALSTRARTSSGLWQIGLISSGIVSIANPRKLRTNAEWDDLEAQGRVWTSRYPQSAMAAIAQATILEKRAWFYRGGNGYADTVSREQFAAMHEQERVAKRYLLAQRDIAKSNPEYYDVLLQILNNEGDASAEEIEKVYHEGSAAFPDYYPIHFAAARFYFPKWGGDAKKLESFARAAMQSRGGEEGRILYARIYWYASQDQYSKFLFHGSFAHWDDMRKGFDALVEQYPDAWNLSNYARFACLLGDQDTANNALSKLEGEPVAEAWQSRAQMDECIHLSGRTQI